MKCTFKVSKKIDPDAVRVDRETGDVTPIGGKYNRPKVDAQGRAVLALDEKTGSPLLVDGAFVPVIEQGTFVQVYLDASDETDECHERHAHGSLQLLGLTEAAGSEFEIGAEYEVTIARKK